MRHTIAIFLILFLLPSGCIEQPPCNTAELDALAEEKVDKIVVSIHRTKNAFFIKDANAISNLKNHFASLSEKWRRPVDTPSTLGAAVKFYSNDELINQIWLSPTTLQYDGCYRRTYQDEFRTFIDLTGISIEELDE